MDRETSRRSTAAALGALLALLAAPVAGAPSIVTQWSGLGDTGFFPPDPILTAGPTKLLLVVNGAIALAGKDGTILAQSSLDAFFGGSLSGSFTFDPKVLFDPHASRFVVVALDGQASPDSWLRIAVSKSSDPGNLARGPAAAADWWGFDLDADREGGVQANDNWADFPSIGVDQWNLYVTANMFSNTGVGAYSKLWILPLPGVLAGGPLTVYELGAPPAPVLRNPQTDFVDFTLVPTLDFDAGPAHLLAANALSGATGKVTFWTIATPDTTPTPAAVNLDVAGWRGFDLPLCTQQGGGVPLDTGDARFMNAVERDGHIWVTHAIPNASGRATRTEARWYEIDASGPGVVQSGEVKDPTRCYFYPGISPDAAGNVGLVMSGVDAAIPGSAFYTGRAVTDPPGTMQPVAPLQLGLAHYQRTDGEGRNRWGDFGGIAVDPVLGGLWLVHEFAAAVPNQWRTWVARIDAGTVATTTTTSTSTSTTTIPSPICTGGTSIDRARLTLSALGPPAGNERATFNGGLVFAPGVPAVFDPGARGAQILIEDLGTGAAHVFDLTSLTAPVPPGGPGTGCDRARDGWRGSGPAFSYSNRSNRIDPPACATSANGLGALRLRDARVARGRIDFRASTRGSTLAAPVGPLRGTIVLGSSAAAGDAGECGIASFATAACTFNRLHTTLRCK